MSTDADSFEASIRIPLQNDGFDSVREEYSEMLKNQLAQGNNGLTKTKYLTFGIEADSMKQAKPRLEHVQNDLLNNFKQLGVRAEILNGHDRLKLMHDMFHMGDTDDKFRFDWKWLVGSGLSASLIPMLLVPLALGAFFSCCLGAAFCVASINLFVFLSY